MYIATYMYNSYNCCFYIGPSPTTPTSVPGDQSKDEDFVEKPAFIVIVVLGGGVVVTIPVVIIVIAVCCYYNKTKNNRRKKHSGTYTYSYILI